MDIAELSPRTRKNLVHMACVAAWSDMSVQDEERAVVLGLAAELGLQGEQLAEVEGWLTAPPPDFDPYVIPTKHRQAFIEALVRVVEADGRLDPGECETLAILRELVA